MRRVPAAIDRIFFLLSPLLSVPLVLRGVFYQNKTSLILFCLCIGILSLSYMPIDSNDKAYYIRLYETYQSMTISEFFNSFLQLKTDIVFYTILFFTAWLGLPFEVFSLSVTFVTCYLIFSVFQKTSNKYDVKNKQAFLFFLIVILAISLPALFSGMRNYLSAAFVFYGFHLLLLNGAAKKSTLFIFLGVITHFSSILYVAVALLYLFTKTRQTKIVFGFSILFIFLPQSNLLTVLSIFNLSDIYSEKATAYLGQKSVEEVNLAMGNFNNRFRIFVSNLWFYIALFFTLLNIKNTERKFILLLCLMTFMNIISPSIILLGRYALVANFVFLLALFYGRNIKYKKLFIFTMLLVNFISFSANFMTIREPFISSLSKVEILTLPTIFLIDATTEAGRK